jgi:uroporphyrinogen decarboxylase
VDFGEGGPRLEPLISVKDLKFDRKLERKFLQPAYETLTLMRGELDDSKAVLGFAGSPWTLASYVLAGGNDGQRTVKLWAYRNPEALGGVVDVLVDGISGHLIEQLKAGADAVQLFDSWVSGLSESLFLRFVVEPTAKIVANVRREIPKAKIIGFPRGATLEGYRFFAESTGIDAVSLDSAVPPSWAVENIPGVTLQGNLDPLALVAGGRALEEETNRILAAMQGHAHIFNLGHGILPDTPLAHVEKLVFLVRNGL